MNHGDYGGTGISFSVSKDGTSNVGLNYSGNGDSNATGMQAVLNGLKGLSLNISSDGQLTLSNQFRGADAFSLSYDANTHTFSPIGVNGNFQNDLIANLVQENAARNAAENAKKLEEKKKVWLENQRQKPGYENLSDAEIFSKYKSDNSVVQDGSRTDLSSQILGAFGDMFSGSTGFGNLSSNEGYLDAKGDFVPNTCFTAGTLVHTKTGTKKIE
ncbi:TIGR04388 family protein, partial [Leptospira kmetyi]